MYSCQSRPACPYVILGISAQKLQEEVQWDIVATTLHRCIFTVLLCIKSVLLCITPVHSYSQENLTSPWCWALITPNCWKCLSWSSCSNALNINVLHGPSPGLLDPTSIQAVNFLVLCVTWSCMCLSHDCHSCALLWPIPPCTSIVVLCITLAAIVGEKSKQSLQSKGRTWIFYNWDAWYYENANVWNHYLSRRSYFKVRNWWCIQTSLLNICQRCGRLAQKFIAILRYSCSPGGVLSTKVYPGTCRWNGSQNQPPGIMMTPY